MEPKMCHDGENVPEQIAKMVLTLGFYYLPLAPFQINKSCSETLDCLFRNTERKKKKKGGRTLPFKQI